MKLAIDISQIMYEGTGVARFTRGLVEAILKHDTKNVWTFFFSSLRRNLDPTLLTKLETANHRLITAKIPPTGLDILWNKIHTLPIDRFVGQQDVIITSDWTEPPSSYPKVTVVHDLVYLRYPETVDSKIKSVLSKKLEWVKKESSMIFADSQSTKDDLITYCGLEDKKIYVIHPGVDIQTPSKEFIKKTREKFNLEKKYILTVGKIEPRKNTKKLIETFSALNTKDVELVIVGPPGWEQLDIANREHIKFLGYVSDEELVALYANCFVFAYPSLWEGFGYPVVEAMKLGAPVLTSNNSSLKEITAGAALLCEPTSTQDIQDKLHTLLTDSKLRTQIIQKGRAQSKKFTWQTYYNDLMEVLHSL